MPLSEAPLRYLPIFLVAALWLRLGCVENFVASCTIIYVSGRVQHDRNDKETTVVWNWKLLFVSLTSSFLYSIGFNNSTGLGLESKRLINSISCRVGQGLCLFNPLFEV